MRAVALLCPSPDQAGPLAADPRAAAWRRMVKQDCAAHDGSARVERLKSQAAGQAFRRILTCCATPVALRWPTRATIRERCRLTSATATSSTRCDTPSCRRAGSRTSGADGHGRA